MNLWGANYAWARPQMAFPFTVERYSLASVGKHDLLHTANLTVRQPGADRLSYLGFSVDDRPLGELISRPERMPDVIICPRELMIWLGDLHERPARNTMLKATGYSYDQFEGVERLGYRLTEVVTPRFPWPIDQFVLPWYAVPEARDLLVYRRHPGPPAETSR